MSILQSQAEEIEALKMELQNRSQVQQQKSVNSVRSINKLYAEIETLKSDHARDLLVNEDTYQKKIASLTKENQALQDKSRSKDQQQQQIIRELGKKYATSERDLTEKLKGLQLSIDKYKHENDELRSLNNELRHQPHKGGSHHNSGKEVRGDEVHVKLKLLSRTHMSKISIKTKAVDKSRYRKLAKEQGVKTDTERIDTQVTDLTEYLYMWPLFRKIGWLYEASAETDIASTDWVNVN